MQPRRIAIFVLAGLCLPGAVAQDRPRKKLVEYGWDVPFPDEVRDNVRRMEATPFDGILLRLREYHEAFDTRRWDEARLAPQIETLRGIEWGRLTDNFLVLNATDSWGMDWFDDAQWEAICENLRLEARAARAGRCVGVAFDPEPYGPNPWAFPGPYRDRPFEQVAALVRKRGGQFLSSLQQEMPGLRLLTLFQLGIFSDLADEPDGSARAAELSGKTYALLPAFVDGMLDAAAAGTRIVDGNEPSYYYGGREDYLGAYHLIKERARSLVAPELRARYAARVEVGMAVYVDYLLARWSPESDYPSRYASPADRLLWLEHDVYWALSTSDEYAWCYGERMNWWKGDVPDGVERAIRSAREKLLEGRPLGFRIEDVVSRARDVMNANVAARLVTGAATVARLAPREKPPRLDGALSDRAWTSARKLEPFRIRAKAAKERPEAATTAWVAYDDRALYLAFACDVPDSAQADAALRGAGDPDEIEIFLGAGGVSRECRVLAVGPGNVTRDATLGGGVPGPRPRPTAPDWRSAVRIGERGWTAEIAIPWGAIGGLPERGSTRRANLCRRRAGARELSCWSAVLDDPAAEPERWGAWRF